MSQKGRLRQTGGKDQRSAHSRCKEVENKRKGEAEARKKADIRTTVCIPCITEMFAYIELICNKRGECLLTYPKILVIESRRPPAGWESRLLKRRGGQI